MKKLATTLLLFLCISSYAQEVLTPLLTNPSIYSPKQQVRSNGNLDSTFVYLMTNLAITDVWDDFSVNKFVDYPPNYTDGNVTSQWFWYLMDATNTTPEPAGVKYCDSSHARHDTISVVASIPTTFSTYYPPHSIWVNDLNNYPISGQVRTLFDECYVVVDSIIDGVPDPTTDTIWYNAPADYEQDSINLFTANLNDPNEIWIDNQACHNYRFAVDPWSLGVATLDAVDSTGWPYEFANTSAYGEADHLTSKPVNLNGTSNVFLQFLYQPQGHGDMPEEQDSLLVDFWHVDSAKWYNFWNASFPWTENEWDTAFIAVPPFFAKNGFRFRFRNYAALSGALDHWHIDYVQLYENPLLAVQPFKDLAVSYPLTSILEDYTSVPWDHYRGLADPNSKMIDTAYLEVYNSDVDPTNVGSSDMFMEVSYDGAVQGSYNLPNPGGIPPWTSNWALAMNGFPFFPSMLHSSFDAPGNDTMATFGVKVNASADVAASNVYTVNDTSYHEQVFKNYYAYDDGSAEVGYGIQGSNSQLAYEFNAYEADTLTGILMHFVPTVTDVSNYILLLTVWDDNNGEPGNILYQDDYFQPHYPNYGGAKNEFKYYEFFNPAYPSFIPVPEKFYVGWEQIESQSLNLGMDRNTNSGPRIHYNVSGAWQESSQKGSLMMRPVFSTNINYTLGIENEIKEESTSLITMYPNPATDRVSFMDLPFDATISLYDMSGRQVVNSYNESAIDISFLERGVYVVDIRDANGLSLFSEKLIKE